MKKIRTFLFSSLFMFENITFAARHASQTEAFVHGFIKGIGIIIFFLLANFIWGIIKKFFKK